MSKVCQICGKKTGLGRKYQKLMSRYNPCPKKRKSPNLQWAVLSNGKRAKVCAKCIKTMSKKGKEKNNF